MALSLAACGGSSTTPSSDAGTDAGSGTAVTTALSFTATTAADAFVGGSGNDTFAATGATFGPLDSFSGAAGTDTLTITDTTSALTTVPAGVEVVDIETINISSSAGLGSAAGVAQVNTYTMSGATADVAGVSQIAVGTIAASDPSLTITYNGNTTGFATVTATAATTATNMKNAINQLAGDTVAYTGTAPTITSVSTGTTAVVGSDVSASVKVGMTATAGNSYSSVITEVVVANSATTITFADAFTAASGTTLTVGGGTAGVTVFGAKGEQPTFGFSDGTGLTVTNPVAAIDGTEGNSVSFKYGEQTGSYLVGETDAATAANFVAALNAVAGDTIAIASSADVEVTAPTAGTALAALTFTGAASDTPSVAYTTANVTGGDDQYDMSGFTGLTSVVAGVAGSINLKLASTTDADLTTSAGSIEVAGGQDLTITHAKTGANDITIAAGNDVTVTANKATTGLVTLTDPSGVVEVNYNGSFANSANATLGNGTNAVVVSDAGASVDVNVTSGAAGATLAATNYTVTQGAISVTGGTATTSVSVSQDAAVTKVDGTGSTGKIGVVQGGVTITDGNADTTGTDSLTDVTIENFGNTVITSTVLDTLNVTADATNASGTITLTKSGAGLETAATSLTVAGSGKIGGISGTQADVYTSVSFVADAALTVADIDFAAATSITASGAGVTTITAHNDDDAVTSYTSTGGGLAISAAIATGVTFTGGAGTDSVILGATTKAISMGAGNDTVTVTDLLGTGGSIAGGDGTDTLIINDVASGGFNDPASEPRATGFETLKLGALANGSYNAAGFTALGHGNTASAVTFSNVAAGVGVTYTATSGATSDIVLADSTGTSDSIDLAFTSEGAIDYTANSADITIAGVETINITSTDSDTTAHTNKADLTVAAAKTIVITGDTGFDVVLNSSTAITTFDASGVVGADADAAALGVTFDNANNTVGAVVTIKGGSGEDTLTGAANADDTIYGNAGVDTIVYDGGSDTFYGGAGKDVFDINADGTSTDFVTIADIAVGDTVNVADVVDNNSLSTTVPGVVELGANATFAEYLDAAADGNGSSTSVMEWFQFEGDTYLVISNDNGTTGSTAGFTAGTDAVIAFTGLVELDDATLASDVFTIA